MLLFIQNLGMGGQSGTAAPPAPVPIPAHRGGKGRRERPLVRFIVELGEDKHYFWTEAEATAFLRRQAHVVIRRAKAVARKTHRIELPGRTALALPVISPLPRFLTQGSEEIRLLSQQINAKIDAVLANPDYEAELDDEDLMRLLQ